MERHTGSHGTGLFAERDYGAGEEILSIKSPQALVLDAAQLSKLCSHCFSPEREDSTLRLCVGCKTVKYCSKTCQTKSWKEDGHQFECKLFAHLRPKILPSIIRLLLLLLAHRQGDPTWSPKWQSFQRLESHFEDFRKNGTSSWQSVELMSEAVRKYGQTTIPLEEIQRSLCRILINTHTLTNASLDPIGICLEPTTASMNHSCKPKAHIVFQGRELWVRSMTNMMQGEEMSIAYVDCSCPVYIRKEELSTRYFFNCECQDCCDGVTNAKPEQGLSDRARESRDKAEKMIAEAKNIAPNDALDKLKLAMQELQSWPPAYQPYPDLIHQLFLTHLSRCDWPRALNFAAKEAFEVKPDQYPLDWHPVRVVQGWVLVRLMVQILAMMQEGSDDVKELQGLSIDWATVLYNLWLRTRDGVMKSHGEESGLAAEVRAFGNQHGLDKIGLPPLELSVIVQQMRSLEILA